MQYRQLGKWGVRLSCLGLGSYLTIGHKCDERTSLQMVRLAYDKGINFFDTADGYSKGEAEKMLGRCLKDYPRSSLFLVTKVHSSVGTGPNDRGLSAKHVVEGCHACLKRLGTDYLDVLMCHRPDTSTPLEETIRAMEDLSRQGKILYWGVSEWPVAMIMRAQWIAHEMGARPISMSELRYNLLYRVPEREIFPVTNDEGVGIVTFSPLAHGMLTGKYIPGQPPPEGTRASDPDENARIMPIYWNEENKKRGRNLAELAREVAVTPSQLAIAWCLRHSDITSVILGARTVEQLEENLEATEVEIPGDVASRLEELYPAKSCFPTQSIQ